MKRSQDLPGPSSSWKMSFCSLTELRIARRVRIPSCRLDIQSALHNGQFWTDFGPLLQIDVEHVLSGHLDRTHVEIASRRGLLRQEKCTLANGSERECGICGGDFHDNRFRLFRFA